MVAGASTLGPFAARYTTLGVLDATFGTSGITVLPALGFGANERTDLVFQSDEQIVVLGGVFTDALLAQYIPYAARLDSDGVLDTTFGAGGPGLQLRSPGTPVVSVIGPQEITGGTTILAAVGSGLNVFSLDDSPAIMVPMPNELAGRTSTLLAALRRLWEWRVNKRTRNRTSGDVVLYGTDNTTVLETSTQSTSGVTDTQTKGA